MVDLEFTLSLCKFLVAESLEDYVLQWIVTGDKMEHQSKNRDRDSGVSRLSSREKL
jgi:hypothetical protein